MLRPESWSRLTGVGLVRVGTGVPGSRARFVVGRWRAERGVERRLFGGSKRAGCSVKRILQPRQSHNGGPEPLMSRRRPCLAGPGLGSACRVLPGVWGVARVHGLGRNGRGPSAWPASGEDRWYKPMVKSGGGQRESEGAVVPVIGVDDNAPGGKGPHFDRASGEGKHQGMAGSPANFPGSPQAARVALGAVGEILGGLRLHPDESAP